MAKKLEFIFDLDSEDVKIATDRTLTLKQEIRLMSNELANIPKGTREFEIMSKKINELKDRQGDLNIRQREFFGIMSALPGPLGMVGGQLDNNIDLMKTFTSLNTKTLSDKFKAVLGDLKDIGKGLLDLTGITKIYTVTNDFLAKSFVRVGIAEETAAVGARAFSAALVATGVGALIVGLGLLIANFDKVKDSIFGATDASKAYEEAQTKVTSEVKDLNLKLKDSENLLKKAKDGVIGKKEALEEWNKVMGPVVGYAKDLNEAERLQNENGPKVIQMTKLKAQAQIMYAKAAEAAAKIVSGEGLEPGFWETTWNLIKNGGNIVGTAVSNAETMVENASSLKTQMSNLNAEGDKLMAQSEEIQKTLLKGTGKKPGEKDTKTSTKEDPAVKAKKEALAEIAKAEQDAILMTMTAREKEQEIQRRKYRELLLLAMRYNQDTSLIKEGNRLAVLEIDKKYDKLEEEERQKTLKKNTEFLQYLSSLTTKKRSEEIQKQLDNLKQANQMLDDDFNLDLERNKQRLDLLNQQEATELSNLQLSEDAKAQIRQKYRDQRTALLLEDVELEKKAAQQKAQILMEYTDYVGQIGSILGMFAGKNVELQKLAILLEKGAAIAKIVIQTAAQVSAIRGAAQAAGWLVGGPVLNPAGYASNVAAGELSAGRVKLSSAFSIAAIAAQGLSQFIGLNEQSGGSGESAPTGVKTGKGMAVGGLIQGPRHAQGGVMINAEGGEAVMTRGAVTMFAPLLSQLNQLGGGTSFNQSITGQPLYDKPGSTASSVMKTYVVSQELTSDVEKMARLKDLSTL